MPLLLRAGPPPRILSSSPIVSLLCFPRSTLASNNLQAALSRSQAAGAGHSFSADGVLQTPDCIFDLALDLISFAFGLGLSVAGHLASGLLELPLRLFA